MFKLSLINSLHAMRRTFAKERRGKWDEKYNDYIDYLKDVLEKNKTEKQDIDQNIPK